MGLTLSFLRHPHGLHLVWITFCSGQAASAEAANEWTLPLIAEGDERARNSNAAGARAVTGLADVHQCCCILTWVLFQEISGLPFSLACPPAPGQKHACENDKHAANSQPDLVHVRSAALSYNRPDAGQMITTRNISDMSTPSQAITLPMISRMPAHFRKAAVCRFIFAEDPRNAI